MTKDIESDSTTLTTTRRNLLIGVAAVVAVAAGGAGYYHWSRPDVAVAQTAGGEVPLAELMQPSPLGDEVLGDANAPITIIEYASMTCPHFAHFHKTVYPDLKKKYGDTGKARFIFRKFPLEPPAAAACLPPRCAGKDKFFPLIEAFFDAQNEWVVQKPLQPMFDIAKQAGFTQQTFDE